MRGVLSAILVVIVAAVCIRLGFWQLRRLEERRERNAELASAMALPVLELDSVALGAVTADPGLYRFRRVRLSGIYDESGTLLLRGRSRDGRPGVHLVTPLRVAGANVLVDRGWLPSPDATTADPRPYREGAATVEGRIQLMPPPRSDGGQRHDLSVDGITVPTYRRLDGAGQLPFYVERVGGEEAPYGAAPPVLDEGPHLGYAVQWFSFAAIAVIGWVVVALRRR